jgi:hypothetical protein
VERFFVQRQKLRIVIEHRIAVCAKITPRSARSGRPAYRRAQVAPGLGELVASYVQLREIFTADIWQSTPRKRHLSSAKPSLKKSCQTHLRKPMRKKFLTIDWCAS